MYDEILNLNIVAYWRKKSMHVGIGDGMHCGEGERLNWLFPLQSPVIGVF